MFGIRTPHKKGKAEEKDKTPPNREEMAGPSSKEDQVRSKVRRSIGEWENEGRESNPEPQGRTSKYAPAGRTKQLGPPPSSRFSLEEEGSQMEKEEPKKKDRVAEARACLNKAKLYLNSARNLKNGM
ncbi:unnamed protein product, partial [Iphiclides podalirius]